ncbi:MAG TPA: fibronectin type III domain-containing protein [Saprospiraceae bacterium]|nr:fibronectin type III domain-containing protein [Saprospiraceae bacterium]
MKLIIKYILLCMLLHIASFIKAQNDSLDSTRMYTDHQLDSIMSRKIALIAKVQGDSVILRWMPANHNLWMMGREKGYMLVRATIGAEEKVIRWDTLNNKNIIKPWSLDKMDAHFRVSQDTAFYISRGLIYDKNININAQSSFSQIMEANDYNKNNHLLAVIAAARSPLAGEAMGIKYIDKGIDRKYTYNYFIKSMVDTAMITSEVASFYINPKVPTEKVVMPTPECIGTEKTIAIRWDNTMAQYQFVMYHIDRSDDGKKWTRVTQLPFTPSVDENKDGTFPFFEYRDSVGVNYKKFYYRVVGIDHFSEEIPSAIVTGNARDHTPPDAVTDFTTENTKDNIVTLSWKKAVKESDFAGYVIGRGTNVEGPFEPIHETIVPRDAVQFIDKTADPHGFNYYVVAAVDTAQNASLQMPQLVTMHDVIPPTKPTNLKYTIDTTGAIKIDWTPYEGRDFNGYLVLYANQKDHEFTPISQGRLDRPEFLDTILINTLTKNIYYKIRTFDKNFNVSPDSDILEVTKPDIVPPVSPVFNHYDVHGKSVSISWILSSSSDVKKQHLYRKVGTIEQAYVLYKTFDALTNKYEDTEIVGSMHYEYALEAEDATGLRSDRSYPMSVKTYNNNKLDGIKNFKAVFNPQTKTIDLKWDAASPNKQSPVSYIIYKATTPVIQQFKYIDMPTYQDSSIQQSNTWYYAVKAILDDGTESDLSPVIIVKIK